MTQEQRFQTFSEFWPFYVREHSRKGTRLLHFTGTTLLFVFLFPALYSRSWKFLILAVVCAYGCAWIGHFFIENNRPATFRYPIFSLMGDFKMYFCMLMRRMESELAKARPKMSAAR